MIRIFLKKNKLFTPVIFDSFPGKDAIYLKLEESRINYKRFIDSHLLDFEKGLYYQTVLRTYSRRTGFPRYSVFTGCICDNVDYNPNIFLLLVKDPEQDKYLIINRDFINKYPSIEKQMLKNIRLHNIPKDNVIYGSNMEILNSFSSVINPKFSDYDEEFQKNISNEFILAEREKIRQEVSITRIESPF